MVIKQKIEQNFVFTGQTRKTIALNVEKAGRKWTRPEN